MDSRKYAWQPLQTVRKRYVPTVLGITQRSNAASLELSSPIDRPHQSKLHATQVLFRDHLPLIERAFETATEADRFSPK
jgi:hypothetical protein